MHCVNSSAPIPPLHTASQYKYATGVRSSQDVLYTQQQVTVWWDPTLVQGWKPQNNSMLAAVPDLEQKPGEQLFPLTQAAHSLLAGKPLAHCWILTAQNSFIGLSFQSPSTIRPMELLYTATKQ